MGRTPTSGRARNPRAPAPPRPSRLQQRFGISCSSPVGVEATGMLQLPCLLLDVRGALQHRKGLLFHLRLAIIRKDAERDDYFPDEEHALGEVLELAFFRSGVAGREVVPRARRAGELLRGE